MTVRARGCMCDLDLQNGVRGGEGMYYDGWVRRNEPRAKGECLCMSVGGHEERVLYLAYLVILLPKINS